MTAPTLIALTGLAALLAFVIRCEAHGVLQRLRELDDDLSRPWFRDPKPCRYQPGQHRVVERA